MSVSHNLAEYNPPRTVAKGLDYSGKEGGYRRKRTVCAEVHDPGHVYLQMIVRNRIPNADR